MSGLTRARTVLTAGSAAALTSSALSMARAQPWRRYPGTTLKPTSTMPASSGGRWNPASPTTAPSGSDTAARVIQGAADGSSATWPAR